MKTQSYVRALTVCFLFISFTALAQHRTEDNDDYIGGYLIQGGRLGKYTETVDGVVTYEESGVTASQMAWVLEWYEDFIFVADISYITAFLTPQYTRPDGRSGTVHGGFSITYGKWFNYYDPIEITYNSDLVIGGAIVGEINVINFERTNLQPIEFDHYTPGVAMYMDYKIGDGIRFFNITEHGRIGANKQRRWSNQLSVYKSIYSNLGLTMAYEYQYYSETKDDGATVEGFKSRSGLFRFGLAAEF